MAEARELAYDECVRLLHAGVLGRAAVSTPQGPQITPMNYSVVAETIVLTTSPYSALGTYGAGSVVAFEIDHFDYETHTGWSVSLRGRAEVVQNQADDEELHHTRRHWLPRPWADGTRDLCLRIPWTELSGRTVGDNTTTPVHRALGVG